MSALHKWGPPPMGSVDSWCTTKFGIQNCTKGLNPFIGKLSNVWQVTHIAINFELALPVQLQAQMAQQISKCGLPSFAPQEGARQLAQEMLNCKQPWPRACKAYSLEGVRGHWAAPCEIEKRMLHQAVFAMLVGVAMVWSIVRRWLFLLQGSLSTHTAKHASTHQDQSRLTLCIQAAIWAQSDRA